MVELQDVFSRFANAYLTYHSVHYEGLKAMKAISDCRTAALGGHVDVCDGCQASKVSYNSCRNRNCPKCGNVKKEQWILDRSCEILPVSYFHTVFTVPHELNALFLANPAGMYSILFKAASETLTKLAIHCIVPGGGLSPSGCSFVYAKKKFFIPVRVLSKVFRGKFLSLLKQAYKEKKLKFSGQSLLYEAS